MRVVNPAILIVDDERSVAEAHQLLLGSLGFETAVEVDAREAMGWLRKHNSIKLVLLDLKMPHIGGLELLADIRSKYPAIKVVIATVVNDVAEAVRATKCGAYNYLLKPLQRERLDRVVKAALDSIPATDPQIGRLVTNAPAFTEITRRLLSYAQLEVPMLVRGETGTGKEIVAEMLHAMSPRRDGPFVAVNVAAIPSALFEAELFGHTKGAFTSAEKARSGYLQSAKGGTLLLDEIGEMPLEHQAKLLRVVQDGTFSPVGASSLTAHGARLIFATNRDLEADVESGRFRRDLFYRLSAHAIVLPPLREREGDVDLLCGYFLQKYCCQYGRFLEGFTEEAMMALRQYDYPGNVRELEGIVSSCVILEQTARISLDALPIHVRRPRGVVDIDTAADGDADLRGLKRQIIVQTLQACNGNQTHAAQKLGIARGSLNRILRRMRLDAVETE